MNEQVFSRRLHVRSDDDEPEKVLWIDDAETEAVAFE